MRFLHVRFGFGSGNRTLIDLFCTVWAERLNTASVGVKYHLLHGHTVSLGLELIE